MVLERHSRRAPWSGVGIRTVGSAFDLGSSPSDDILDFSLVFFDFGFYRGIDFLRGMVE